MNTDLLWNSFLAKIKTQVSSLSFETWFMETKLLKLENNKAFIIVPLNLHKTHLVDNYLEIMENTFLEIIGTPYNFEFLLESEIDAFSPIEIVKEPVFHSQHIIDANLNDKYTFETFIVGKSNKFAFTASRAVAEKPGKAYNPLFLYGKSGLGKTHLMHSIGNYIIKYTDKQVLYVSSDNFVNDFINAFRYNDNSSNYDKIENFKNKYRNIDVLIIDDIQFLGNATKGQEEFFHTFNELYNSNKQIIIASDRSVDDLRMLENRLLTRFNWGLTANITPPDLELRISIIENKIAHQEIAKDIPKEVIEYIANNFDSDVRQLEGAITRVCAFASMMNHGVIDLDTAVDALKDQLTDRSTYKNDIHRIQRVVCDYYKINIDDMKSKKRSQNINFPRQIAIYLCRVLTTESFPKIGTYFGGRDHSTIINSYQKIDKDLKNNPQLKDIINELKKELS